MNQEIKVEQRDRIGYIILNRPERGNALDAQMVESMMKALSKLESEEDAKVIVLKAMGNSFCTGADLDHVKKFQHFNFEENLDDCRKLKNLYYKIYTFPKVVIAQIQGNAVAGGCGLAAICDFSCCTPDAYFGYPEVKSGCIPAILHLFLLRKIGEGKARELLLEGELIPAELAREYGLINRVVPSGSLEDEVYHLAQRLIRQNSARAMAETKEVIAMVQGKPLSEALEYAVTRHAKSRGTPDCKKGMEAFIQQKTIIW